MAVRGEPSREVSDVILGPAAAPRQALLSPTLAGKRVLICEDDGITLLQLARAISRVGALVVGVAATGEDALCLAAQRRPDVILMDVDLAGVDGLQAAARMLKESPEQCVVIVTVADDPETRARAARIGAAGFVPKPLSSDSLVPQLELACQSWSARYPC